MEHRLSVRRSCVVPLVIRYRDETLPTCLTHNCSRHGLLVSTGEVELPRGAAVEVKFPDSSSVHHLKGWALVIHSQPGRAGVWFDEANKSIGDHLRDLLERSSRLSDKTLKKSIPG